MPPPGIRRVVTTHAADGSAVVLADGIATNVRTRANGGIVSTLLWTTDASPATYSNADRGAIAIGTAPPPRGSVLRVVTFPPEDAAAPPIDRGAVAAEMGLAHDAGGRRAPRHPFMHATDSVDYAIVLDGEIDMLLDDDEVHLSAGDILVQQGTNHAWVNRGDRPCSIAFVLIDATGSTLVPDA
jgi:mannose-6-phosphate isomerase-like protein (cupin superfamily)